MSKVGWHLVRALLIILGQGYLVHLAFKHGHLELLPNGLIYLLAGVLVGQISVALFALRFKLMATLFGFQIGYLPALSLHVKSMFYFFFLPLAVGADVAKFAKLSLIWPDKSKPRIATMILADRLAGFLALTILAAVLIAWVNLPDIVVEQSVFVLAALSIGMILIVSVIVWQRSAKIKALWAEINPKLFERRFFALMLVALLMPLTVAYAVYIGSNAVGVNVAYLTISFVIALSFMAQVLPVSILGAGMTEIAATGLYSLFGIPLDDALLLVAILYVFKVVTACVGGILELLGSKNS